MIEIKCMNTAQTVFTVFYAVAWGALANVWPRWRAFDWALRNEPGEKACQRGILSLTFLNILPFIFFSSGLLLLNNWVLHGYWISIIIQIFLIALQSLTLFGFYRIWVSIVQCCKNTFYPEKSFGKGGRYNGLRPEDLDRKYARKNLLVGLVYLIVPPTLLFIIWLFCK
jgi:hypothetical protein